MKNSRRSMIKTTAIATTGLALGLHKNAFAFRLTGFTSNRPLPANRRFTSDAVENLIIEVKKAIADEEIAWLFENCYPNTLDTTVTVGELNGKPDTFVITGDIKAMWLRDSTAQVWPYLPLVTKDKELKKLIEGVIRRQTRCINIDPYANAFNKARTGSPWITDKTTMKLDLHERKWEIDSLCYPIRLAHGYWQTTGDTSVFDDEWQKAARAVLATFKVQQRKTDNGPYKFQRITETSTDTLPLSGYGNPTNKVGLVHSMFRPSDDACIYPFLIPSNLFAQKALMHLVHIYTMVFNDAAMVTECTALANEIGLALEKYAFVNHPIHGKIMAYEVDGFGNTLCMDDANVPSLLGLPYLGCVEPADEVYQNTRRFVLSADNPYFFKGQYAEGIGGPHVGMDMIWPMSITMRALTSTNDTEITQCLKMLKATHAGTGFMHEAFNKNNPTNYTRKWFAWANTLFGELIVKLYNEKPEILKQQF
jgi:meiotically up-regulated gene 157 (Mug157) protein